MKKREHYELLCYNVGQWINDSASSSKNPRRSKTDALYLVMILPVRRSVLYMYCKVYITSTTGPRNYMQPDVWGNFCHANQFTLCKNLKKKRYSVCV